MEEVKYQKQIVITSYGIITSLGMNKEENEEKLFSGKSGIKKCEFEYKDGTSFAASGIIEGELQEHTYFKKHGLICDRASNLALFAADECINDSGLEVAKISSLRVGIVVGTSLGGMRSADRFHAQWIEEGIENTNPELIRQYPLHAVVDILASNYGFCGAKVVISTACSSGANAIGMATDLIRDDLCDIVLTGGIDPISRFSFAGFSSLKAIDVEQCRPYSQSTGINLGEGAAFFLLETDEHAKLRNANILAEVRGYGLSADAYHPTAPDVAGNGAVRAMNLAMLNGNCLPKELSYINGHGTGTPSNDHAEVRAWKSFVKNNVDIPLISNKASIGHCMGAAGAVELAFSLMSILKNKIPPTINFDVQNTETEINFVPNDTLEDKVDNVLSNSFAFGGNNCSVLLSRYKKRKIIQKENDDIVITGIGCTGTGGGTIQELYRTFDSGINWIEKVDISNKNYKTEYKGKIVDIPYKKYIPSKILRRIDNVTRLAMVSGRQALVDSRIKITPQNCNRVGVIYGTGTGPLETIEMVSHKMIEEGKESVDANIFPNTVLNAAPGQFSIANMLKGPTSTISAGSVSGLDAFIYAVELLKNDQADAIIVLTADEWNETLQVGNERLGLLSTNGAKPFSKGATGMILSQGSTAFVLEQKKLALERGANILAEVYGYSMTSDNAPLCSFDEEGSQWLESMKLARKQSNNLLIDYYASTAYGIPVVDRKEAKLMMEILDKETNICSIPRLIGATSGSLGTYGLLSCIYALQKNNVPNQGEICEELMPEFEELLKRKKKESIECTAVSAASFGGAYTSVIIGKVR